MTYEVPSKYENECCGNCHEDSEKVYHACTEPCGRLLTWAAMNAGRVVKLDSKRSVELLRERQRQRSVDFGFGNELRPPFDSVGGD